MPVEDQNLPNRELPSIGPVSFTAAPDSNAIRATRVSTAVGFNFKKQPSAEETIARKMRESHITEMFQNEERGNRRAFIENQTERVFRYVMVIIVLICIVIVSCWAIDKQQYAIVDKIVVAALSFVAGIGAKSVIDRKSELKPK